jgi:sugar/nucleoside kinase (ribokinase family)
VTFLDRTTPSYTALLDREGELLIGFADMALYEAAFAKQMRRAKVREALETVDAVLCDANLPTAALERLAKLAEGKPIFAVAISPAKVVRLVPIMGKLAILFMNRREAATLAGMEREAPIQKLVSGLQKAGLGSGVITSGSETILGFDKKGSFAISPPAARHVADVTGAGDALAGATVAALLKGLDLRQALREGVAAALLAIESPDAVPKFDASSFAEALALVPQAEEVA